MKRLRTRKKRDWDEVEIGAKSEEYCEIEKSCNRWFIIVNQGVW